MYAFLPPIFHFFPTAIDDRIADGIKRKCESVCVTHTTPLTDSSWSPLFRPPWRLATPPGITREM